ncbi:glycosyltransferase involved in cell wall biosynthesis [Caldalkalibacillus uzonensis]|uniref:Glycosyltransferase involved in cell wall biosynthesis n=1 Tax=Caldalkalibacillus uzonensis TaxID=353224 RepID=A0ABU0CQ06_9BACI|nr:glycosyltransferase family 4 protein [Caldalkalibacillus uzonensis]MDQ0338497.1 glycosyltransferase involved in cell wall biosynthesis [Caldalkalibacillus uzonensis]
MKVLQVIGGAEKGGSRNHLITLTKNLNRNERIQSEIVCFINGPIMEDAQKYKIPCYYLPMNSIIDMRAIFSLRRLITKLKPDIIHTHGVRGNFIGRLAAYNLEIPVVTTVHSSIYYDYSTLLKKWFYHRIEQWTRPLTDQFITVSKSLKHELINDGVAPNKVSVVYNGISDDLLNSDKKRDIRKELNIPAHLPLLITVGRLEPVKNQKLFIHIVKRLQEMDVKVSAIIAGDGPLKTDLQNEVTKLGLDKQIHFLGFRNDIQNLLEQADIFLLTSRMEGLPITLLEAMAAQTPVVVSAVGGIPEVVELANNGETVPNSDIPMYCEKIIDLISNNNKRKLLGENGYFAFKKYFTENTFVTNTLNVYHQILKSTQKAYKERIK